MEKKIRLANAYNYLRSKGEIHTQKDLARRMETTPPNVSSALKGVETVLTDKFLQRFNAAFDNIFNIDWLLNGEGEMLNTPIVEVELVNEEQPEYFTDNKHGNHYYKGSDGQLFVDAPLVPYCALGCPPDEYEELAKNEGQKTERFKVDKVGHGRYFSFLVDGDSMDDGTRQSFERGDIILVRELDKEDWQPSLHIKQWKFWVVCWQNCVRLKQIVAQDGNIITLHSLNPSPEYTDFKLNLNDVQRLFNVIKKKPKTVEFD